MFFLTKIKYMKQRKSISIDKKLTEKVRKEAQKQKRTFSGMVGFMLDDYLERQKLPKK
tara:strand:- start:19317 stop:19490 length:174 start_codon:yes stop_codon:yes gene_type:complete